jgi:hypothetical protein
MKNSDTKPPEIFQDQFEKFRMLIAGSKMAKVSTILLICFSLLLMFYAEKNLSIIVSLFLGAAVLGIYINKFLILKNIDQNSYTSISLTSSIFKFKEYMTRRKKFEIFYISIWAMSLIPFLSTLLGSDLKALMTAVNLATGKLTPLLVKRLKMKQLYLL